MIEFTISGAPRTKKNSERFDFRGPKPKKRSSAQHEKWFNDALSQAPVIKSKLKRRNGAGVALPLKGRYWITAHFFLENAIEGDLLGYEQALADWLQMPTQRRNGAGFITDDKYIDSWDGSRRLIDRENPRIEVTIRSVEEVAGA